MGLIVETWPIERLVPYARNPRKNDAVVDKMASAIKEFGFRIPIVAKSDGSIVDGHLRLKAAQKLGLKEVPVALADELTDAQVKAFRLLANKSANWAEWDDDLLKLELDELKDMDFNLELTGFDSSELDAILTDAGTIVSAYGDDDIPKNDKPVITRVGDVWLLGDHRLICGDAGEDITINKLMGGEKAKMCFTSPPYSQQRNYNNKIDNWFNLMKRVFSCLPMEEDAQLLVNLGPIIKNGKYQRYWDPWIDWMYERGWRLYDWYVWDKGQGLPGRYKGHLLPSHEWVFHFNQKDIQANKTMKCSNYGINRLHQGLRNPDGGFDKKIKIKIQRNKVADSVIRIDDHASIVVENNDIEDDEANNTFDSVIRIDRQIGSIGEGIDHPAVFPVALPKFIYPIWTRLDDIVFEPFSGSGTSIIAAQKTGRKCRAVEISPEYVDIACIRFSRLFPDIPVIHFESGKTFDEIAGNDSAR